MHLLSTLRDRIERADVLVMDLAGHNAERATGSRNGCCDEEKRVRRSNHPEAKDTKLCPAIFRGSSIAATINHFAKAWRTNPDFVPRCEREF